MKDVPIDEIEPGTLLAAALTNDKGSLILNRGTPLTESILARLHRIGVETLPVSVEPQKLEQERKELLEAIEKRFQGTRNNPFLQELKHIAIEHLSGKSAKTSTQIV